MTTTSEVGRHDFVLRQGGTFSKTVTWKTGSPATPVDITGYTARMQIREKLTDSAFLIELTTENGRISLSDAANGELSLYISATDTAALDFVQGVYDLEIISGGGVVTPILEGIVTLSKEVTR